MVSIGISRVVRVALSAAFAAAALPAVAASPVPQSPLELTNAIDPVIDEWVGKGKVPGAVVVVVNRDGVVFAKGYGYSDIEARIPFTSDATLVRPGSISKPVTGIAVMQLVDAGLLDLDRDVNDYIDFAIPTPANGVPVTLRRLLTHRAGFEEHVKGLYSKDREPVPLGRWLARNQPPRLFPKGDIQAYSNYGLALAGYIVERVSGESYASYVQRHIFDPLGMKHSTFQQPLPEDLARLVAKGYRPPGMPALAFFETISAAPAGALSATGTDMGRFMRALLNGGTLDGVRILSKARLDEMMAPVEPTPAGYVGLTFIGTKVAGQDAVGHNGALGTMTFFSDLQLFPEHGIGVFVSRNGLGDIENLKQLHRLVTIVAERFLPRALAAADLRADVSSHNDRMAGVYQSSRRSESSVLRLSALVEQRMVKIDRAGDARLLEAIWPFGEGMPLRRVGQNVYEVEGNARIAFVDDGAEPYLTLPSSRLQRVPWTLDVRWIVPALLASTAVILLTLLAWPVAAAWRWWRTRPWSRDRSHRAKYLTVRSVLVIDLVVILAAVVLFIIAASDPTTLNDRLDPVLLVLYVLAWLGVVGAIPTVWTAISFWRDGVGSHFSRIHHSLIAASSVMCAWFFLTFRIAGTTLIY